MKTTRAVLLDIDSKTKYVCRNASKHVVVICKCQHVSGLNEKSAVLIKSDDE